MDITLKAPPHAKRVHYGASYFGVQPDGTLSVPSFAVPELVGAGCTHCNAEHAKMSIDVRKALETCPGHHLSIFLNARDIRDHWFDPVTHYHSKQLRDEAAKLDIKTQDGENLLVAAADHLDSLHRSLHQGKGGRIVVIPDDEKRKMVLDIHDAETSAKTAAPAVAIDNT